MKYSDIILTGLLFFSLLNSAFAQEQHEGKTTNFEIGLFSLEDESVAGTATIKMKGRVWISTLLGEPVLACSAEWSFWDIFGDGPSISVGGKGNLDIPREVLGKITLHSVMLGFETPPLDTSMFAQNTRFEMACDPGAMEAPNSGKPSFTVPGSYPWEELFYERYSYDGNDKNQASYVDAATAKAVMLELKNGGFETGGDSARILSAEINLGPVQEWLDGNLDMASDTTGSDIASVATGGGSASGADGEEGDFWRGGGKYQAETAEVAEAPSDEGFWSGDISAERRKHQANTQAQQAALQAEEEARPAAQRAEDEAGLTAQHAEEAVAQAALTDEDLFFYTGEDGIKLGYRNRQWKVIIAPRFYDVEMFSEGLAVVANTKDSFGVIDKAGNWIIPPRFYRLKGPFSSGLISAQETANSQFGYIDRNAEWIIPPRFQYAHPFHDRRAQVVSGGLSRIIDPTGQEISN